MKTRNSFSFIAAAALLVAPNFASADNEPNQTNPYLEVLSQVKAPELAVRCGDIVSNVTTEQRDAVTVDVVAASAKTNPAALSSVVGAIAQAHPEVAALAAATAVSHQPKQTSQIVRAAVSAAPEQTGAIVYAVCVRNPGSYRMVAALSEQLVPQQKAAILEAVNAAMPEQRPFIEQAQANSSGSQSAAAIISDASQLSAQSGLTSDTLASANTSNLRGPTVGPPYKPLNYATPGNSDPGDTSEVPEDDRDGSAP